MDVAEECEWNVFEHHTDLSWDTDFIPNASLSWLLDWVWYVVLGYEDTIRDREPTRLR